MGTQSLNPGLWGAVIGIAALGVCAVCPVRVSAQPSALNVEVLGQIGGECRAVAVQSGYAYVGIGPSFFVLDVSDPAPIPARTLPGAYTNSTSYSPAGSATARKTPSYLSIGRASPFTFTSHPEKHVSASTTFPGILSLADAMTRFGPYSSTAGG